MNLQKNLAGIADDPHTILRRLMDANPTDIFEVRLTIEPQAALAVVSNGTLADIQSIREAHEMAAASNSLDEFEHWDALFHSRIFAATRNDLLIGLEDIISTIRKKEAWLRIKKETVDAKLRAKYAVEHGRITDALARRNSEDAQESMRVHIKSVANDMFPVGEFSIR